MIIRDHAVAFGKSNGLVGIVTEPAYGPAETEHYGAPTRPPAVVLLNTGVTHRVGANRMSTTWSRRLAAAGHFVLRFDQSGIGDSERRQDNLTPLDAALADLRDAIDWLQETRGLERVILVGLCTGADLSLLYGGSDPRVVGIVLIDPSTPPTRRFYAINFARKFVKRKTWQRLFGLRLRDFKAWREKTRQTLPPDAWKYRSMPLHAPQVREILGNAYQAALASDVRILAIFTAGPDFQHNYRNQLIDAFPNVHFGTQLQLEYFDRCDHLLTHEVQRKQLFDVTSAWLNGTSFVSPLRIRRPHVEQRELSSSDPDDLVSIEF